MAYKYTIKTDYVFSTKTAAAKNTTKSSSAIKGAKNHICELVSGSATKVNNVNVVKINVLINGKQHNNVWIKKGNISLNNEYKYDIACKTSKKTNMYQGSANTNDKIVIKDIPKGATVKALHGSTISNITTRVHVKYTKGSKSYTGWVPGMNLTKTKTSTNTTAKNSNKTTTTQKQTNYLKSQIDSLYSVSSKSSDDALLKTLQVTALTGIYGAPYQFMASVDRRLHGNKNKKKNDTSYLGRAYSKYIIADMPLLLLTPGKTKFLSGFSKASKDNAITALSSLKNISNVQDALSSLLSSDYRSNSRRYYTFGFDVANYYNYVNPMLWNCAMYLGIGNKTVTIGGYTAKLKNFKWEKVATKYGSYLGYKKFVAFYLDSEKSISQTFSNSTTESAMASGLNGISDTAREIQFLTGATVGKQLKVQDKEAYKDVLDSVDKVANKYLNGSSMFKSLAQGALTIASGGRLLFPEVWSDSNYTTSYDISMKLRTPDADVLSWYLNICVPMCHLISMAAPRQLSGNGYASPFLVRAFYKGLFNIDTGMIDQLSFNKGKDSAWTPDGLPTEVDVTMSIKDMYNVLFISGLKSANSKVTSDLLDSKYILKNTGMMDYLANMCGVNVTQPELARTIDMYLNLTGNALTSKASRWASGLQNDVMDKIASMYQDTFGW